MSNLDNTQAQMRKGVLEFCILSVLSHKEVYTSDIIGKLKEAKLIVVEGTLYPLLTRLKNAGLQFSLGKDSVHTALSDILKGITIVVTGTFSNHSRDELKTLIENHGGKNGSSVTSKTTYLLAGNDCGPGKLKKAEDLKVKVISEEEFEKLIAG